MILLTRMATVRSCQRSVWWRPSGIWEKQPDSTWSNVKRFFVNRKEARYRGFDVALNPLGQFHGAPTWNFQDRRPSTAGAPLHRRVRRSDDPRLPLPKTKWNPPQRHFLPSLRPCHFRGGGPRRHFARVSATEGFRFFSGRHWKNDLLPTDRQGRMRGRKERARWHIRTITWNLWHNSIFFNQSAERTARPIHSMAQTANAAGILPMTLVPFRAKRVDLVWPPGRWPPFSVVLQKNIKWSIISVLAVG